MEKPDSEIQKLAEAADAVLTKYREVPPIPAAVYHYTSLESAFKIIKNRTIRCSNVVFSNDPSEAEYGQKFLNEIVPKDEILKLKGLREVISGLDCYAASFSAEGDLLPQWRAYCLNGRGVAVGVNSDVLRQRSKMVFMRVLYSPIEQEQIVKDLLEVFRKAVVAAWKDENRLFQLLDPLAIYLVIARSAFKSPAYESEREYRLFDTLPKKLDQPHPGLEFRTTTGSLIPFLTADLTASKSAKAQQPISDLRVGPCLNSSLISAAIDLFRIQNQCEFTVSKSAVSMRCD